MKKFIITAIMIFAFLSIYAQQSSLPEGSKNLTYKIIPAANKTWGYDIYNDNRPVIHQPSIPALPGNDGFKTKQAAEKVAKKVIEKMNKGENPPSISIDEMKKMGVL